MKRFLSCILVVALLLATSGAVYAENATLGKTVLSANVTSRYTVTIPANNTITYGALSSNIGSISVTQAQIEVGKQLLVTATCDNKLKNSVDTSKTIPYALKSGGVAFTNTSFQAVGSKALTVDITQNSWDSAAAGSYSDTITFTVSYVPIS